MFYYVDNIIKPQMLMTSICYYLKLLICHLLTIWYLFQRKHHKETYA